VLTFRPEDGANALARFRANGLTGLLLTAALLLGFPWTNA
jgi:hypothetical protein